MDNKTLFNEKDFNEFLDIKNLLTDEFENMELPQKLKAENMISLIENIEPDELITETTQTNVIEFAEKKKFKYKKWAPLAYAAAFTIVIGAVYTVTNQGNGIVSMNDSPSSSVQSSEEMFRSPTPPPEAIMGNEHAIPYAGSSDTEEESINNETVETTQDLPKDERQTRSALNVSVLKIPKSYQEVAKILDDARVYTGNYGTANPATGGSGLPMADGSVASSAPSTAEPPKANPSTSPESGLAGTDFSTTNTQVATVDEGDIIKTDGSMIYRISQSSQNVSIVDATSMEIMSQIQIEEDIVPIEMYLTNSKLAVVYNEHETKEIIVPKTQASSAIPKTKKARTTSTTVEVFDVEDSTNPKSIKKFSQSGNYNNSRVYNDTLYLISYHPIPTYYESYMDAQPVDVLPTIKIDQEIKKAIPINSISIAQSANYRRFAVVSAMDINGAKSTNTKAILGGNDNMYMSEDNIYLTSPSYTDHNDTEIIKIATKATAVDVVGVANVNGYIDNQFSMDEYNGNFRIATTSYKDGTTLNNVYILDKDLNQIGALENLAPDERIYSVRFMGDKGYVVTFKQIDPLFVIDLADPKNPKVLGELKIPGFSEYMHPIDENTLIGFGVNTKLNANGGVTQDGLKLSMFDVSDPLNPKESHNFYIGNAGSYSSLLNDHKALMYHKEKQLIGFPVAIYKSEQQSNRDRFSLSSELAFEGFLVVEFSKENGFKIAGELSGEAAQREIDRGIYIDKNIYTSSDDMLSKYSLEDYSFIKSVKL